MKTTIFSWIILPLLFITHNNYSQSTAVYDISFTSLWNSTDHGTLPPDPHWSDLVGCNHKNSFTLWKEGAPASLGVKRVAELGVGDELLNEINNGIANNIAEQWLQSNFIPFAAISTATLVDIEISSDYPLLSLISMIAPSPDWFIGIEKVSLVDNFGEWIPSISIDVYPWDAGTDSGNTYTANNIATNPPVGITSLQGITPFSNEKIGTFTITLKTVLATESFNTKIGVVYPNPVENNLIINNNVKEVQLYNLTGNIVLKKTNTNNQDSFTLNLEEFENGIYFLKILNQKSQYQNIRVLKK